MVDPEDINKTHLLLQQCLEQRLIHYQSEFRINRADGNQRWIESFAKIAYASNGEPLRMVGVNLDITIMEWAFLQNSCWNSSRRAQARELDSPACAKECGSLAGSCALNRTTMARES